MLTKYSLLCVPLFTWCAFVASSIPAQEIVKDHMSAMESQRPQRELAKILKRLKNNAQEALSNLHEHMQYNSEHQHNNPLIKQEFPYNVIQLAARYCATHKDIDWLRTKQDKDQRVIINLEALQPILTDPSARQELALIINGLEKDQHSTVSTLVTHKKVNDAIFYGLPLLIFVSIYRSAPHDQFATALGCSAFALPIYYLFKHKDIGWLRSDIEQRTLTIQDLQKLAATLPKSLSENSNTLKIVNSRG